MAAVLLIVSMALAAGLAGVRLALKARGEVAQLRGAAVGLEDRVVQRTAALETALETSAQQARLLTAADRAKADFLDALGCELRNPLNVILGFADLLSEDAQALSPRQRQAMDRIVSAGLRLRSLVERMGDLAQAEAGRLIVSVERVDPGLAVREVCAALGGEARAAGVVVLAPPAAAGLGVVADRARLQQILTHLVDNAIRYNRADGQVVVEIRRDQDDAFIAVHDTGRGLSPAGLDAAFTPLRRTDCAPGSGPGVGLAVSRRLAEAMGGRLEAASCEGEGSTFTLILPLAGPAAAAETPLAASEPVRGAPLAPATLLVVEADPDGAALMRQVAASLGPLTTHVATSGGEGLALARALKPELILLSLDLPDVEGIEVKARLEADPLTRDIPVLALSASTRPAEMRRGREANFAAVLTKPFEIARLSDAVSDLLPSATAQAA